MGGNSEKSKRKRRKARRISYFFCKLFDKARPRKYNSEKEIVRAGLKAPRARRGMVVTVRTEELFDLGRSLAGGYLKQFARPWEALGGIAGFLRSLIPALGEEYREVKEGVFVHKTASVSPTAFLGAPCIIGAGTEIRHGAFIRGSAIVGENCVVGNSAELKNCILFDGAQVPHFNYVGDSILGYKAHMGAGAVTSNLKSDRTPVSVRAGGEKIETGLVKFGAMIGDQAEIGCNCVLNPGTVVGRRTRVYPLSSLRGAYPADAIVKDGNTVVPIR